MDGMLTDGDSSVFGYLDSAFGRKLQRYEICSITFTDTLEHMAKNTWDVPIGHDKSVMAWTEKRKNSYHLNIGMKII